MKGRCVCGFTGSACKVRSHQVSCPEFAAAYRAGPVPDPEQEYRQWAEAGRPAAKAAAHEASVAETDRRREDMAARFAARNLLED